MFQFMAAHRPGFVYLDIETSGLDSGTHSVIAAAHQRMDANGPTEDQPTVLTSWGLKGEKPLLRALDEMGLFTSQGAHAHDLIPVGSSRRNDCALRGRLLGTPPRRLTSWRQSHA
jgi:hypothetical protein